MRSCLPIAGVLLGALIGVTACASQIGARVEPVGLSPSDSQAPTAEAVPSTPPVVLGPAGVDVRSIDWETLPLPGAFCEVAGTLVFDGAAVTSSAFGDAHLSVEADSSVFGDLDGDGADEAAVRVSCVNGGGTASGQLAFAYIVVRVADGVAQAVGSVVPQQEVADATHVTLIDGLRFQGQALEVEELFYRSSDMTCCPTGYALTRWVYRDGRLIPGKPVITTPVQAERGPYEVLSAFLGAWQARDTTEISEYVYDGALYQFTEVPESWTDIQLNWGPDCEPDASGSGSCSFTLIAPEGGGVTYVVSYGRSDRSYRIYSFQSQGGGA